MWLNSALMSNPSNLLKRVTYSKTNDGIAPEILYGDASFRPLGKTFSFQVDKAVRYCLGWHDLATSASHQCPDTATIDPKYDSCPACQKRTGFNPAFYNASSVSPQQEALNQEPHILYLAHFGSDYLKVGISRHKRGLQRLYEQGARSALILDVFPTALIARQYEALIAKLPHIHETTSVSVKRKLLEQQYDATSGHELLLTTRSHLEAQLNLKFSTASPQSFDPVYFPDSYYAEPFSDLADATKIAGTCLGVVGGMLIMQYNDHRVALYIKQFYGYPVAITETMIDLDLQPKQASLF